MKERISPVGKNMKALAGFINERLERAGVDIRQFNIKYYPKCEAHNEGAEWTYLRDEGDGESFVDFTENGEVVIEHKLEDLGNLWGEAEKKIFLEFEPQLAVLRQLLNIQNRALKTTAKVAKKVAKNALRD